jgi:hypothetical protein
MAISSSTRDKQLYLGVWAGTSADQPFTDYTRFELFEKDGAIILRRYDTRAWVPLEGETTWTSPTEFEAVIPAWIRNIRVSFKGVFRSDGDDLILDLALKGDGMTGLEDKFFVLTSNGVRYERYQTAGSGTLEVKNKPDRSATAFFGTASSSEINLTPEELDAAVKQIIKPVTEGPEYRIDSLLILKDGKCIRENYWWGMDYETPHIIASLTKSIVSLLGGIAWDKGLFDLDDIISDTFAEIPNNWAEEEPIRVRHVLSMTSGTKFGIMETSLMLTSKTFLADILKSPRAYGKPGEGWHYDNGLTTLFAVYLERKTGVGLEEYARKHLFEPLGITNYVWTKMRSPSVDGEPFPLPSGGLCLTVPDLAKIGVLLLNNGTFKDQRIISEKWIQLSTQRHTKQGDYPYGFFFHLNDGFVHAKKFNNAYMAMGSGGQIVWVVPEKKLIFVTVGSSWKSMEPTPPVLKRFAETILERL